MVNLANTLENKAKFFAQYWGNVTEHTSHDGGIYFGEVDLFELKELDSKILLKPLSSITDEDQRYILSDKTCNSMELVEEDKIGAFFHSDIYVTDYLRSKGYALPYIGLSVEKQIEYGWIKLI